MIARILMWLALKLGTLAQRLCKHEHWEKVSVQGIHMMTCRLCARTERFRR